MDLISSISQRQKSRKVLKKDVPWDWGQCLFASFNNDNIDYSYNNRTITDSIVTTGFNSSIGRNFKQYNGSTSYTTTSFIPTTHLGNGNDFTVICWVYIDNSAIGTDVIWGSHDIDRFYLAKFASPHRIFWGLGSAAGTGSTVAITSNTWCCIAVVRKGSLIKIYINGIEKSSDTYSGNNSYANEFFHIGSGYTTFVTSHTPCSVADLAIFNFGFSKEQVETYSKYTFNPLEPTSSHFPIFFANSEIEITVDSILNIQNVLNLNINNILPFSIKKSVYSDDSLNIFNSQNISESHSLFYQYILDITGDYEIALEVIQGLKRDSIIPISWTSEGSLGTPRKVWILDARGKVLTIPIRTKEITLPIRTRIIT